MFYLTKTRNWTTYYKQSIAFEFTGHRWCTLYDRLMLSNRKHTLSICFITTTISEQITASTLIWCLSRVHKTKMNLNLPWCLTLTKSLFTCTVDTLGTVLHKCIWLNSNILWTSHCCFPSVMVLCTIKAKILPLFVLLLQQWDIPLAPPLKTFHAVQSPLTDMQELQGKTSTHRLTLLAESLSEDLT